MSSADVLHLVAIAVAGTVAGFVNTLAGAGSLLTLPVLISLGLPPDVANGTNRIGVFLASLAGAQGFAEAGKLDRKALFALSAPVFAGAVVGSIVAVVLPVDVFKPIMLGMLAFVAVMLLWKPSAVSPPEGTVPFTLRERPSAVVLLFVLGAYAAFLQAGMGIFTVLLLSGVLRYDLIRANALKAAMVLAITTIALVVFIPTGKVRWIPGLALGVFQILGARVAVKYSLNAPASVIRKVIFVAAVASIIAAAWDR